jgi:hypothetical protein
VSFSKILGLLAKFPALKKTSGNILKGGMSADYLYRQLSRMKTKDLKTMNDKAASRDPYSGMTAEQVHQHEADKDPKRIATTGAVLGTAALAGIAAPAVRAALSTAPVVLGPEKEALLPSKGRAVMPEKEIQVIPEPIPKKRPGPSALAPLMSGGDAEGILRKAGMLQRTQQFSGQGHSPENVSGILDSLTTPAQKKWMKENYGDSSFKIPVFEYLNSEQGRSFKPAHEEPIRDAVPEETSRGLQETGILSGKGNKRGTVESPLSRSSLSRQFLTENKEPPVNEEKEAELPDTDKESDELKPLLASYFRGQNHEDPDFFSEHLSNHISKLISKDRDLLSAAVTGLFYNPESKQGAVIYGDRKNLYIYKDVSPEEWDEITERKQKTVGSGSVPVISYKKGDKTRGGAVQRILSAKKGFHTLPVYFDIADKLTPLLTRKKKK